MTRAVVAGCGSYLPSKIMTNDDLSRMVDTNDTWIRERTGITQRHIAAKGELTSDLAAAAAREALAQAGVSAAEVDTLIVATTTPDDTFPSTAVTVQAKIGATDATAFDLQAVCSGFVYAMKQADALIRSGQAKRVLVIGAETMSRVLDWTDRRTCILFGDGAGAVLLVAEEGTERGILATHTQSDGTLRDILKTTGGTSSTQTAGVVEMNGQEVFRHAVKLMASSGLKALEQAGLTTDDISWLVPHQANARILTSCANKLKLPEEKLVMTVDRHANTSSASIPLALADAVHHNRFSQEDIIVMPALGAGLTWGTCIIRW